jgi:hypothetical protein
MAKNKKKLIKRQLIKKLIINYFEKDQKIINFKNSIKNGNKFRKMQYNSYNQ